MSWSPLIKSVPFKNLHLFFLFTYTSTMIPYVSTIYHILILLLRVQNALPATTTDSSLQKKVVSQNG